MCSRIYKIMSLNMHTIKFDIMCRYGVNIVEFGSFLYFYEKNPHGMRVSEKQEL